MRRSQKEYLRSTKEWLSLDKRLGLYLFLLALLIRFSYLFLIGDHYLLESGDQSAYEGIALKYAQDKGFMPGSSYRSPLYPLLLGLYYKFIGHSPFTFKLFQAFLGSFIPLFLFRIGRNTFHRRTGLIAALIAIFDPVLVHYTSQLFTETLFFFLLLGAMDLLSRLEGRGPIHRLEWISLGSIGVLLGLGTLTRSILFLFPLVIGLWLLLSKRTSIWCSFQRFALIEFFFLLTLSPWILRNTTVHGKFIPLTTNFGANLWIGNNPEATGGYHIPLSQNDESFETLSEWERNHRLFNKAIHFIFVNPKDFSTFYLKKMRLFWSPYPHFTTRITFWFLLTMSLIGIVLSWRRSPWSKLFLLTILYFYALTCLFFIAHRFTVLVFPFLILFAGYSTNHILEKLRKRKYLKRVCILRHSYYPEDSHVVRNAGTLKEAGYAVEVICLRNAGEKEKERIHGVQVYRLPVRHHRGSKIRYLFEYSSFFLMSGFLLTFRGMTRPFDVIEVDNPPDFLIFSTILPKLLGAKVVLYLFEPMPELFQSNFHARDGSLQLKFIRWIEKMSIRYADHVIVFSEAFYRVLTMRCLPPSKGSFIYSVPDDRILNCGEYPPDEKRERNGFELLYHGTLLKRYGLQVLIQAIAILKEEIPNVHLEIIGEGEYRPALTDLVNRLGVQKQVCFRGYLPYARIPQAIRNADAGIVPILRNQHTNLTIPIKLFEYVAMKKPVIATRMDAVQSIFDDGSILFFESSDASQLVDRIVELYRSPLKRSQLIERAYHRYQKIQWSVIKEKYCRLMEPIQK